MKKFKCWLDGHEYVFGVGYNTARPDEWLTLVVCERCGARNFTPTDEFDIRVVDKYRYKG